ncbi:MAG: restriction endonuclease subunit S, partial [Atopobiaceae bacterium]|nr:restriction endonuclease subunit S [Atopobiaceae bacterium]
REYRKSLISEAVTKGLDPDAPMKDSGVEWIGEIPRDWDAGTIASVTNMITNGYVGPTRDLFVEDGVRYLQSLHVVDGELNFSKHPYFVSEEWSAQHSRSILVEGDVLVVQTGAIGNCAYVSEQYAGCTCHALIILRPNEKLILGRFLFYYLYSDIGKEKVLLTRTGATHPHLNSTKIRFTSVVVPPISEQQRIVAFLDAKTAEIDSLIEAKQQMADKLREYRKSLISEAVTGKFKVPGVK